MEAAFLNKTAEKLCAPSERRKFRRVSCDSEVQKNPAAYKKLIIEQFAKAKQTKGKVSPVWMAFCANVLKMAPNEAPSSFNSSDSNSCGNHAVLAIGRRQVTRNEGGIEVKKCQILIRNSWGKSCGGGYHPTYQADQAECARGGAWVDEDVLLRATYGVHTIR